MTEFIETVVIGAGQAGLAASYHLKRANKQHLVLERATTVGHTWRHQRWDSFTLVTPNWMVQLPGAGYQDAEPDGFLTRDQVAEYLEAYATRHGLPVRCGVTVRSIRQNTSGDYVIDTSAGAYRSTNAVVAMGLYQRPRISRFAGKLDSRILQLHSSQYRNPAALPEGSVLVVGAGQSGTQITEDLYQSGRKTFLSVGRTVRVPRRYRGRDIHRWSLALGMFDRTVDQLKSPRDKFEPHPTISGRAGGRTLNLHQFARDGVVLLGRLQDFEGTEAVFGSNLSADLAAAGQFEADAIRAPPERLRAPPDASTYPGIHRLDLAEKGITSVIWASGYDFDFDLIELPTVDAAGYPIQTRGVGGFPGLYFLGLPWMHSRRSGLLFGVGDDAAHVVGHLIQRRRSKG
jgi:putative flavoprotein involved in K+ transport